ncbi:quinolinate synthase NadA [Patescibacteria group bacterium]|nr:quinolinate synthase NadA [Patescibacteria group bacterium]MBU1672871.1 quinolinate synthase NadA [Patescibacteria group bacterium]MBU1963122.1 quinolinate synthase NadA [Patescibacteria group bacterium]
MEQAEVIEKINKLKKEKNAVLLVHNYQRPEIYEVADFMGDSLELAREASKTNAEIIIFCGVDFMAESAKILNPDKLVLLPTLEARCPMAAQVDIPTLKKMQAEYPDAATVGYVNTTAATKAHCDVCCTSANAVKVVKTLPNKKIIFLPDENLANYVAWQAPEKKIIPWPGFCYVHSKIMVKQVREAKKNHPQAKLVVHPECPIEVCKEADVVTSTTGMSVYVGEDDGEEYIIVTEQGMVNRLKRDYPGKTFYSVGGICIQMKKNNLENILNSLEKEMHVVEVDEKIAEKAKQALDRMLAIK